MSAKSIPKVAPFPPFVLDSYRMLYLEKSGGIVRVVVEGDPGYMHHAALKTQVAKAYEKVADQLTNLILRIVLVAEAEEGAETKTFPRAFVIDGDDYTVVAEGAHWSTADKFTFKRAYKLDASGEDIIDELKPWPIKYKFTFCCGTCPRD